MSQDSYHRFPQGIDVNVRITNLNEILHAVHELLDVHRPTVLETQPEHVTEPTPLDHIEWLIEHGVHLTIGLDAKEGVPYIRTIPTEGIKGVAYKGALEKTLPKLRHGLEAPS